MCITFFMFTIIIYLLILKRNLKPHNKVYIQQYTIDICVNILAVYKLHQRLKNFL